MLVIADDKKVVAIAGVMGSLGSQVDENTTMILLESANFIDHISFTEGEDINSNNLDEKLLKILHKNG